jgi:hypothetical protein
MAEIVHARPPIYDRIVAVFPAARQNHVVFTYGDKIYNPSGGEIHETLMAHEETHVTQQTDMGKDIWWDRYLEDPTFRIVQELAAYQKQFQLVRELYQRPVWRKELNRLAKDLSSPIYGDLMSFEYAKQLIKG